MDRYFQNLYNSSITNEQVRLQRRNHGAIDSFNKIPK
uniref:Uncharacterized protein n=1 Tax=Arundo donax TaxID=35708 RepID=A0A0A8XUP9_ARUDO